MPPLTAKLMLPVALPPQPASVGVAVASRLTAAGTTAEMVREQPLPSVTVTV